MSFMSVPVKGPYPFAPNDKPFADPADFSRDKHREAFHADTRRFLKSYVKPGGIGAEVGVFWGHFAQIMAEEFAPAKLHLVDPWHRLHGEHYPDWGRYTNFGQLTTAETLEAARALERQHPDVVRVHVDFGADFMAKKPDGHFDWVYLDAHHRYEEVKADVEAIWPKIKPGGLLVGDDYYLFDTADHHPGVVQAASICWWPTACFRVYSTIRSRFEHHTVH
jgi:hypothetical protein